MRALHRILVLLLSFAFLGGVLWYFGVRQMRTDVAHLPASAPEIVTTTTTPIKAIIDEVAPLEVPPKKVSAPSPLIAPKAAPKETAEKGVLTRTGVVMQTNAARTKNGLPVLKENAALNNAAALKLKDMFAKQYFAHVSPDGKGPEFWVVEGGYAYLAIGENLAEESFTSDSVLVASWLASAPHRANILNTHFEDIGVAVGKGTYAGRATWMAVQMFGRPQSACPVPSATLKAAITAKKTEIDTLEEARARAYAELEATEPKHGEAYREKVQEYNALVAHYNALVEETKQLVAQYNAGVAVYNVCLKGE